MKVFTIIFLVLILVVTGCTLQDRCDTSYSFVNGACCLDKNANDICDTDETQRANTVVRERPVVLVQETCHLPRFECLSKDLTEDFVSLDLKFERDEIITIKKMTLSSFGCSQEFDKEMRFNDNYEFVIPCVIEDDAFKTEVVTEAVIQPILRHSNGQIYDYGTPTEATLRGEVGGAVR